MADTADDKYMLVAQDRENHSVQCAVVGRRLRHAVHRPIRLLSAVVLYTAVSLNKE
jgi:hypothetical protein